MFNDRVYEQQSCPDWPAKRNKPRPLYTRRFRFFWQLETGAREFYIRGTGDSLIQTSSTVDRLLSGGYPRLTIPRKKAPSPPPFHLIARIGIPAIQKMCQTRFPYPFAFLLFSPRHRYIFPTWRFSFRTTRLSRYSLINIIARQSCSSSCPSSPLMGNVRRADRGHRFHPPPHHLSVNDFVSKTPLERAFICPIPLRVVSYL